MDLDVDFLFDDADVSFGAVGVITNGTRFPLATGDMGSESGEIAFVIGGEVEVLGSEGGREVGCEHTEEGGTSFVEFLSGFALHGNGDKETGEDANTNHDGVFLGGRVCVVSEHEVEFPVLTWYSVGREMS